MLVQQRCVVGQAMSRLLSKSVQSTCELLCMRFRSVALASPCVTSCLKVNLRLLLSTTNYEQRQISLHMNVIWNSCYFSIPSFMPIFNGLLFLKFALGFLYDIQCFNAAVDIKLLHHLLKENWNTRLRSTNLFIGWQWRHLLLLCMVVVAVAML